MTYTNAAAATWIAFLTQLALDTIIPKTQRNTLVAYYTKLGAKSTNKSEDRRAIYVVQQWMIQRHKITA